jgi:hypothetical protein
MESVPKTCPQIERSSSCRSRGAVFTGDFHFPAVRAIVDSLLSREVLDALSSDNKNPRFCWDFKPSPGLEPGAASLPWRLGAEAARSGDLVYIADSLHIQCFESVRAMCLESPSADSVSPGSSPHNLSPRHRLLASRELAPSASREYRS